MTSKLCVGLFAALITPGAIAASPPNEYSLSLNETPLDAALKAVFANNSHSYVVDPTIAGKPVTGKLHGDLASIVAGLSLAADADLTEQAGVYKFAPKKEKPGPDPRLGNREEGPFPIVPAKVTEEPKIEKIQLRFADAEDVVRFIGGAAGFETRATQLVTGGIGGLGAPNQSPFGNPLAPGPPGGRPPQTQPIGPKPMYNGTRIQAWPPDNSVILFPVR